MQEEAQNLWGLGLVLILDGVVGGIASILIAMVDLYFGLVDECFNYVHLGFFSG